MSDNAMQDLKERLTRAKTSLQCLRDDIDPDNPHRSLLWPDEFARLNSKLEGVNLALSYVDEALS